MALEFYPLSATVEKRASVTCPRPVEVGIVKLKDLPAGACGDVLGPLLRGDAARIGVSKPGSAAFAVLEFEAVGAYVSAETPVVVPRIEKTGEPDWTKEAIPASVVMADTACYVRLDRWYKLTCNRTVTPADEIKAGLDAAWRAGKSTSLVMKVRDADAPGGAWRRLSFSLAPEKAKAEKPAKLVGAPPSSPLHARCQGEANRFASTDKFYAICADVFATQKGLLTLDCAGETTPAKDDAPATRKCTPIGDTVRTNRPFTAFVWHPKDQIPAVQLGGGVGFTAEIRDPGLVNAKAVEPGLKVAFEEDVTEPEPATIVVLGPRKSGSASFSAKATTTATPSVETRVEQTFVVESFYRLAWRLGVAFSIQPFARKVEARTNLQGQRVATITEGAEYGLVSTSLVTGLTAFLLEEVGENSSSFNLGVGVRLGIIGISNNDVRLLDSLMLGLELCTGPDVSLGIFAGVGRHDTPPADQAPGRVLIGNSEVSHYFNLTPQFSMVLTLTPAFLARLGLSK